MILPTINHYNGNQTRIKTETGVWSVVYNAENRPIRWESGDTVITMAFDRMGRRVEMRTVKDGEETLQRFVYDNYLCIQQLRGADNALFHSYIWDPTEPIATRPLIFLPASGVLSYYFHDGNKNVSDLVSLSCVAVHYDYPPFGACNTNDTLGNPIRFSSEMHNGTLGLVYYNYRYYSSLDATFLGRDIIATTFQNTYRLCANNPVIRFDLLGLLTLQEALLQELADRNITPSPIITMPTILSGDARTPTERIFDYYRWAWGDQELFNIWVNQEEKSAEWRTNLPNCPKCINIETLESPGEGWGTPHPRSEMHQPEKYHPEAEYELRTLNANEFGAGNQCIYDANGCLIQSGFSAGTTDRKQAPDSIIEVIKDYLSQDGHLAHDVAPFDWAYRLDGNTHGDNVRAYIRVRPPK